MKKTLLSLTVILLCAVFHSQCLDPGSGPYANFNNLGGVPCNDGSGGPFEVEITTIEIWSSDSYAIEGVQSGSQYRFSACNNPAGAGMGGGLWDIEYTIVANDGTTVEAFGLDAGSDCAITWTASQTGVCFVVIREAGECSAPYANDFVDNGFPKIECVSCLPCPVCDDSACEAGLMPDSAPVTICPTETSDVTSNGIVLPTDSACLAQVAIGFEPQAGATGGLVDGTGTSVAFRIVANDPVNDPLPLPYEFDADVNGIMSGNGLAPLLGEWRVRVLVLSQGEVCDSTSRSRPVTFLDYGEGACPEFCEDGNLLNLQLTVDNYPQETGVGIFDAAGDSVYAALPIGSFAGVDSGAVLDIGICLPDGCFELFVLDEFGDGMCCEFGNGGYVLTDSAGTILAQGGEFAGLDSTDFCLGEVADDCSVFDTAPVDLTKSFDPVNGIRDRVQVKWYKESPAIRYTDEDAAMCDIKFWAKRTLDPITGDPVGAVVQDPDTLRIDDVKKVFPDNSPRSIFKWPIKFRADGANNTRRAEPNIRYEWQVRCECGHDGDGPESPWSAVKIFNTPDFDTTTGIYTLPEGIEEPNNQTVLAKKLLPLNKGVNAKILGSKGPGKLRKSSVTSSAITEISLFPNPADGQLNILSDLEIQHVVIRDMTGRLVLQDRQSNTIRSIDVSSLPSGTYTLELETEAGWIHEVFMKQ